MATALNKKIDVVIVGLGAVGGVTALPLTRAGIEVVAGTTRRPMWSTRRGFAHEVPNLGVLGASRRHEIAVAGTFHKAD